MACHRGPGVHRNPSITRRIFAPLPPTKRPFPHQRQALPAAPVYGWFTEGFDTADLKEAKALLEELK